MRRGYAEDETYEFGVPPGAADTMEAREPGKCPKCGAAIGSTRMLQALLNLRTGLPAAQLKCESACALSSASYCRCEWLPDAPARRWRLT